MRHTIDEVKELQAELGGMQEDARDLVAELRGIARALRSAPATEPAAIDERAAVWASEGQQARDRKEAAWFESLGAVICTDNARGFYGRG
jgi:signal transduction histidine kinase